MSAVDIITYEMFYQKLGPVSFSS